MSSILLDKSKLKKLNSVYNSNLENAINNIEFNQTQQDFTKPEYLKQFDDLTFDNMNEPSAINDIHKGANEILSRNLDFQNNFSQFQKSDMHYGVVDKYKFTHNNMIPNTAKRDFSNNADRSDRKLETFTGISDTYTRKVEKVPLFEPMNDLTWVQGMPNVTDKLQNRYLTSTKNNNGNLPFENKVKILPGVGGEVQTGRYSVYRINPVNVDNLRSEINKKVTYTNKPLETIKKGEMRGPDFNLTTFKMPDFREKKFSDLLPSKTNFDAHKLTGKFTNVVSQRGENEWIQPGPAINSTMGDAPNKNQSVYGDAKKENYMNDISHSITGVSNKPVMTNVKSFTNNETHRSTTNTNYEGPISSISSYVKDYKDIPLTTLRELMINGDTNIGISGQEKSSYIFSNDMILPITNRQQYTTAEMIGGASGDVKNVPIYNEDKTKPTIRQSTSHSIAINTAPTEKTGIAPLEDKAKTTIREGTENTQNIGGAKSNITDSTYHKNNDNAKVTIRQQTENTQIIGGAKSNITDSTYHKNNDNAKVTIRQQTENTQNIGGAKSNISDSTYHKNNDSAKVTIRQQTENTQNIGGAKSNITDSTYHKNNDSAKVTIRQQTENTQNIGSASAEINKPKSHMDANNMSISDCREISTYNRPSNGKSDLNGPYINRENVKLNEPLLYSYTPNPHQNLDFSVTPTVNQEIIREVYKNSRPIIDTSSYHINANFINTLKNNPYVNDIYHQKNYK